MKAGHGVEEVVTRLQAEGGLSEENASFVRELVSGVIQNKGKIDHQIQSFAPAWPIEQIPAVSA